MAATLPYERFGATGSGRFCQKQPAAVADQFESSRLISYLGQNHFAASPVPSGSPPARALCCTAEGSRMDSSPFASRGIMLGSRGIALEGYDEGDYAFRVYTASAYIVQQSHVQTDDVAKQASRHG